MGGRCGESRGRGGWGAAGLSQAAAAIALGFAQSRIAKLETGSRRLLFSEAVDLARLYGVALDAFEPTVQGRRTPQGRRAARSRPVGHGARSSSPT